LAPPVSYIEKSGVSFLDMTIHDFDMARVLSVWQGNRGGILPKGAVFKWIHIVGWGIDTAVVT